jgi:hypothetical protein
MGAADSEAGGAAASTGKPATTPVPGTEGKGAVIVCQHCGQGPVTPAKLDGTVMTKWQNPHENVIVLSKGGLFCASGFIAGEMTKLKSR